MITQLQLINIIILKNPTKPPGIDPGTVRLVAQRLKHYATPGPCFRNLLHDKESRSVRSSMNCVLTQNILCVPYFSWTCQFIVALITSSDGSVLTMYGSTSLLPHFGLLSFALELWFEMSSTDVYGCRPPTPAYCHWKKSGCVMSGLRNLAKRILTCPQAELNRGPNVIGPLGVRVSRYTRP